MAHNDKTESANETQDHSQPLDDGGFFSLNDVITAGRHQLTRSEHLLAADTRRNARNLLASAKLLALVVIVSLAMGVAAWAFLASLNIATDYREHHAWIYALLPVVGMATAWLYKNHGLAAKRGNNLVIDSALGTRLIHMRMAVLTFVCSTLTHLTGGSAGREGAAVQIGGTIASNISSLAHLKKHDHHDLMLAGISSAFGAVFGSPLAGAFFGMEMCFIGKIDYTAGIYCLVASFTGYFYITRPGYRVRGECHRQRSRHDAADGCHRCYQRHYLRSDGTPLCLVGSNRQEPVRSHYHQLPRSRARGCARGARGLRDARRLEVCRPCHGSGAGFAGNTTLADAAIKLVVTALTTGAGFQGGEVTPLFGIGAALGGWIGCLTGLDPSFLAALGMLGVFCAGLNVPITTCMMAIDLFHGTAAGFFVIVAFISYLTGGHRGVYPAQRIISPKRRSLIVDEGGTVADAIERHNDLIE